ncbi:MAG: hypothetical protein ACLFMM_05980 [Methanohalobium sp.]|uniref:hypothetical protein n=1 Tax=Methanohalobium sp. TaxID=2837493 RepID=UPI00397AD3BA
MLLENGYARVYDEAEIVYMEKFQDLEQEAITNNEGSMEKMIYLSVEFIIHI